METSTTITTSAYYGNLKPAYSKNVTDVQPTSLGTRLKKFFATLIGSLILAAFIAAICMAIAGTHSGAQWPFYVGGGIAFAIIAFEVPSIFKSQQAACPYCGASVGNKSSGNITRDDKNTMMECPKCFEWLISNEGQLRAFKNEDITDQKEFKSPLFVNSAWPDECIVCGNPTVKYSEAKNTSVNFAKLLVGRFSWASGAIKNVPYCAEHNDEVKLKIDDPDVILIFKDYDARRRYLAVNPNRVNSKVK